MTLLVSAGDGIQGERLVCILRRVRSQRVTAGSARHRQMEITIEGTPAKCFILKPVRALVRGH